MFKKILCPTDLSAQSTVAIAKAVQLARLCKAEIVLLNVRPEFISKEEMVTLRVSTHKFLKDESDLAVAARKVMEAEFKEAGGGNLTHKLVLREGEPDKEILAVAEELGCDLIVITTTGRNRLLEHVKGSDAEHMVAKSHVPILVLPAG